MSWILFLDDIRDPGYVYDGIEGVHAPGNWTVARSSEEAIAMVKANGMPEMMSLDHDLGETDTSFVFLHWLSREFWDGKSFVPGYRVHSANPVGAANLRAFMDSWRRSCL